MESPEQTTVEKLAWPFNSFISQPAVRWMLALVTFAFIFIYHTYPLGLSDFWWHLNTGRWIWVHGAMPSDDPFLFSSASPLDARASLILRGYPLSQLLFFGAYTLAGESALVVLKGVLMTLFYGLLWNQFRRSGLHLITALAIVGVLPLLFFRFDELRPQVFSFIFTLLVLQLVEAMLAQERRGRPLKHYLFLLPVIMLLWANLHRGFIIGIGILFVYLFSEWIARKKNPNLLSDSPLSDGAYRRFLILVIVSTAISFVNPVGLTATWANSALSRTSLFTAPLETGVIPSTAVDYLIQAKLAGNVYNFFEYGGYLSWRLYPQNIFIDQRNLSWDTYEEYSQSWRGDYVEVFRKYQIGVVFYPVYESHSLSRLVVGLLNDKQWGVGYYDGRNIIFLRNDINGNQPLLNKPAVIENIKENLRAR